MVNKDVYKCKHIQTYNMYTSAAAVIISTKSDSVWNADKFSTKYERQSAFTATVSCL